MLVSVYVPGKLAGRAANIGLALLRNQVTVGFDLLALSEETETLSTRAAT